MTPEDGPGIRIAGVVPCAGESTRMGEDKALLDAGGLTFLERVVGCLRTHCDPVVVVVRAGRHDIAAVARRAGASVLVNPDPADGPIASIRVALRHLIAQGDCAGMVLLPVDHPAVGAGTVGAVISAFSTAGRSGNGTARQSDRTPSIAVPMKDGRTGHPPLFGASVFDELLAPDLQGGARTVLHSDPGRVTRIEVDDPGLLLDIDTPADWRAAVDRGLLPSPVGGMASTGVVHGAASTGPIHGMTSGGSTDRMVSAGRTDGMAPAGPTDGIASKESGARTAGGDPA